MKSKVFLHIKWKNDIIYVDCTPLNIHTLIKASSPEKHTVQDTYKYNQSSPCDNSW